jgi:prepilin-type N-terminal cleavage/methylation domain-containing protein/prepilin-type processing-associated H-X9-DG protein
MDLGNPRETAAFTLLEMLAVLAIMAILGSLLSAALNSAKNRTHQIICLNHLRQLQWAWDMYVDDHEGALPLNRSVAGPNAKFVGRRNTTNSWVAGNPREDASTDPLKEGTLYSYLNSTGVYRCPSDHSTVLGKKMRRTRSYSMSAYMNGDDAGLDGRVKTNSSAILNPSKVFVFIEEHEHSAWAGSFGVMPRDRISLMSAANWSSTPADRHSRGCNLTFADGHIEYWRWSAAKSFPPNALHQLDRNQAKDLMRLQISVPTP